MLSKKNSSRKSKSAIKNIVTINANTQKYYIFKDEVFKPLNRLSYNTSNFVTSYIGNKDLITATIELSRSIPAEDIADMLDIKAYEELGLDQATDYMISYHESEGSGEARTFHTFVVKSDTLTDLFLPIKEQTKYLDLIVPAPLLYKPLYRKEILADNGTHCFVYFTKYDAFITIYKDGEYVYSKSIEFSLEQIYEKYCEIVGEKVDEKEFFNVLETEGLKTTKNEYQQTFMKIFGEIFITINDVIIYVKRAFKLDIIDQLFIGSVNGPIIGLDEYSQNYLGLQSSDFNFNYNINNDEWYTDQLQYLMLLSSLDYMEDEESSVNLTIFPRAPSFVNRPGGQFLIAVFAAISIGLAYPLFYLIGSYINDAKIYALRIEDNKLKAEATKYKTILDQKRQTIKKLDKEIGKLTTIYNGKAKTLTAIHDKKVNYRLKSGTYYQIAEDLNKFKVHVDQIRTADNTVWLSLVSSDDRKFTKVIKYISDTHFNEIEEINIDLIEKDPKSEYYRGILKVVLR